MVGHVGDPGTTFVLLVVGLLAVFGVQLALTGRRAPDLDVRVSGEHLVVHMKGWDAIWAHRARVRIPLDHVVGVRVEPVDDVPWRGIPVMGTVIPGVLRVGTLLVNGERELWNARRSGQVLRIELAPGSRYHRLWLQVAEPSAAAARLRPHVGTWVPALL